MAAGTIKTKAQLVTDIDSQIVAGGNIDAVTLNGILQDVVASYENIIQEYTTVQRDSLTPFEGQKIYNTTSNRLEYYSATKWLPCSQKETVAVDCSANPNYQEALVGDQYTVTVAGKIGGASGKTVYVGDLVYCISDNAGGTEASVGADWKVCYSASSTDSPTRYAETTLSSAQILALNTTPVTLIAAPGAGKFNLPTSIIVTMTYNSAAYTTNTSMCLYIDDNGLLEILDLSGTANKIQVTPFSFEHDIWDNVATRVNVSTGDPAAGNSTVKIGIYYKIHTL